MPCKREDVEKRGRQDINQKTIPDAKDSFESEKCNLKLVVSSSAFKGLSLIETHKLVLNSLKEKFESGSLHALSLETKSG